MVCSGMVCFHELTLFMKVATPEEKAQLALLMQESDKEAAVRHVGLVLGINLTLDMLTQKSPL